MMSRTFEAFYDVVVPEAEQAKALCFKIGGTRGVGFRTVLAAIELDDQTRVNTEEIDDKRPDRRLPAELEAVEPAVAHRIPEFAFDIGHVAAETRGMRTDLAPD